MKIKRSSVIIACLVVLLLFAGWLAYSTLNNELTPPVETGFRDWFWQVRRFDLLAQVVLIFAGTLGIAALLPMEDYEQDG
ncbi:MAG TPA: hypothetical protein ENN32_04005 [Chloroflexi bacterium]|nr:hypothetical protein [Chloroflexota bacterium]